MARDRNVRLALWTLALACFGLGAADRAVLGFAPDQLLLLAAVFAAVTAEYSGGGRCEEVGA